MEETGAAVTDQIVAQRIYGRTTCAVVPRDAINAGHELPISQLLDAFVARFGFTGIGDEWAEVSVDDAKTIVREVLRKDLAYGATIMPDDQAAALAERFFSLLGQAVRCFTNGNLVLPAADPRSVPKSWTGITPSILDTGVVCFDEGRLGILWVEDED
jgi:hypothetical protein